jgi:hypothetical protein
LLAEKVGKKVYKEVIGLGARSRTEIMLEKQMHSLID